MYSKELDPKELEKIASNVKRLEEIIKDYIGTYKEVLDIHDTINNLVAALFKLVDVARGNTSSLMYSVYRLASDYYTVYICLDRNNTICVSKDFGAESRLGDVEKAMIEVIMNNTNKIIIDVLERLVNALDRLDFQVLHKLISIAEKDTE